MKKLLFVLLIMFSAAVFSSNNQRLEVRPVLFLDSFALYQPYDKRGRYPGEFPELPGMEEGYRILELQEASVKMYRQQEQFTREFNEFHDSLKNATSEAEKVKISSKLSAISKAQTENIYGKAFGDVRDKMCKRVTELSEEYAKEMGACAVVEKIGWYFRAYVDPSYDITMRIIDRINKEYLERKLS